MKFVPWERLSSAAQTQLGSPAGFEQWKQQQLADAGYGGTKENIRLLLQQIRRPRGSGGGQFSPTTPTNIFLNPPEGAARDVPVGTFNTITGDIEYSGGRGPGSTLSIGDEGYQAAIDRYNQMYPEGRSLTSLAGVSGQMSGIASQLGDYGTQMGELQSQFGQRGETLSDLQSQFGQRGETISGMQEQIGGFGKQFTQMNEGIGSLTSQYGDMQKLLNNFQSQTAQFSGGIQDQLGRMEGRIGQLEQNSQMGSGGGFGGNNFNPVYPGGGGNYTQPQGYGGSYMPLNFGTGLNIPNNGGYPSSAYYGGISPFMFGFY